MATLFFHNQRKTYHTRAYIPRQLRRLLRSRVELWRSLDTADADAATLRSAQWDARLWQLTPGVRFVHNWRICNALPA